MTDRPNGNGRRPSFDNRVSLGNVLSIVAMVATVLLVFYDLKGDVRVLETTMGFMNERLARVENWVYPNVPWSGRP